jgi:hypothetical protein
VVTHNYSGFGLIPVFLGVGTRRFGNWIFFHPQVKGEEEDTYSVWPLREGYSLSRTSRKMQRNVLTSLTLAKETKVAPKRY